MIVLGMYGGSAAPTPYLLPKTRKPADVVAVAGHLTRPTILILVAYEPTIWDLSGVTGRSVSAVYVSGFHSQGVTGVGSNVRIAFRHSQDGNGPDPLSAGNPCPDLRWPYGRPEAMRTAIRIRREFGKWPTDFYGSYAPLSFGIGTGSVPPYARVPDPADVRAEGPLVLGDARIQAYVASFNRELSASDKAERDEERRAERRGRRLLHMRWNKDGDVIVTERELFGADQWRERISR
jgi:hypothetical protein